MITFTALVADRLDKSLVSNAADLTRSAAQRLINHGRVFVNGAVVTGSSHRILAGDTVSFEPFEKIDSAPAAEAIPLQILFEDDALIVINKPAGMAVHPGAGNMHGTLVNAVLAHAPDVADAGEEDRPGIVHRLDKESSGVMLVAKTDIALIALQAQFKARAIRKTYFALCVGVVQPVRAIINKPIGRHRHNRQHMAIVADGREAVTEYYVLASTAKHSLVRAFPRTGRTHQLRVHFASIGFPIVGDALYGGIIGARDALSKRLVPRHLLHAARISFAHPLTGAACAFDAPLPVDFAEALGDAGITATW